MINFFIFFASYLLPFMPPRKLSFFFFSHPCKNLFRKLMFLWVIKAPVESALYNIECHGRWDRKREQTSHGNKCAPLRWRKQLTRIYYFKNTFWANKQGKNFSLYNVPFMLVILVYVPYLGSFSSHSIKSTNYNFSMYALW